MARLPEPTYMFYCHLAAETVQLSVVAGFPSGYKTAVSPTVTFWVWRRRDLSVIGAAIWGRGLRRGCGVIVTNAVAVGGDKCGEYWRQKTVPKRTFRYISLRVSE